ncbi:MAG: DUF2147 domain-containing protein, partial [Nonlabens sp.]|nr:DUF2147 domain-containing protein [Nonlabens sp.]
LCSFVQGNSGGFNCENCERHYASFSMPMASYDSYFPSIPIQTGMEWRSLNEQIQVTEINMKGLKVSINLPENLTENIDIGSYYLSENPDNKVIDLWFQWEIIHDDANNYYETGYVLNIDKNKPYNIDINCIDRTNQDKIRLSGSFSATFVGKEFSSNSNEIIYEIPISGNFSYNITL